MHPIRTVAACTVLLALSLLADRAWAKNNVPISGTHSPGEIRQTCQSNGGEYYSGGPGNSYGCMGQQGSVSCESNGKCKGSCQSCGTAQMGRGGIQGILKSPTTAVGNAPPPGNPSKGRNPIAGGSTVTNPNLLSGGGANPTTSSK